MNDIYDWIDRASDPYGERHRYEAQNFVDGIPIDPVQRYYFDMTPNDERSNEEVED